MNDPINYILCHHDGQLLTRALAVEAVAMSSTNCTTLQFITLLKNSRCSVLFASVVCRHFICSADPTWPQLTRPSKSSHPRTQAVAKLHSAEQKWCQHVVDIYVMWHISAHNASSVHPGRYHDGHCNSKKFRSDGSIVEILLYRYLLNLIQVNDYTASKTTKSKYIVPHDKYFQFLIFNFYVRQLCWST